MKALSTLKRVPKIISKVVPVAAPEEIVAAPKEAPVKADVPKVVTPKKASATPKAKKAE